MKAEKKVWKKIPNKSNENMITSYKAKKKKVEAQYLAKWNVEWKKKKRKNI